LVYQKAPLAQSTEEFLTKSDAERGNWTNNPAIATKESSPSPEMPINFHHHNRWAATGSDSETLACVLKKVGPSKV
jgi:hypothetical protein